MPFNKKDIELIFPSLEKSWYRSYSGVEQEEAEEESDDKEEGEEEAAAMVDLIRERYEEEEEEELEIWESFSLRQREQTPGDCRCFGCFLHFMT